MVYSMRSGLLSPEEKWYFIALKCSRGYAAAFVCLLHGAVLKCTALHCTMQESAKDFNRADVMSCLNSVPVTSVHIMSCLIRAHHVMSHHCTSCHVIPLQIISCHTIAHHIMSHHCTSCHVTPLHIMSGQIMSELRHSFIKYGYGCLYLSVRPLDFKHQLGQDVIRNDMRSSSSKSSVSGGRMRGD